MVCNHFPPSKTLEYKSYRLSFDNLVQTELSSQIFPMFAPLRSQRIKSIASGTAHTLFLTGSIPYSLLILLKKEDGRVFTFGKNFSGRKQNIFIP